jgi:enoyl-CoA hydratase/3-hydroxyacyl-CoA dehydrogenase
MGPFQLIDLLGLDTVLHVAEHLRESYGDRFYVHHGMQQLVAEGKLGAKTGGEGFYAGGEPSLNGAQSDAVDGERLAELLTLKSFVEACLVLEEGVATHRDIDVGLMAGRRAWTPRRGLFPPFMKADFTGLDVVLGEARAGRGGARRALRAADRPAPPGGPGPPGAEVRAGLLRLPPARPG